MALVVSEVAKMEWDTSQWLQLKAKGGRTVFRCAGRTYKNANGDDIDVFFLPDTAFIFDSDEEGLWNSEELIPYMKENWSYQFPYNYDEYQPVIRSGEVECDMEVLEKYGLTEHKADIEARLRDVAPFGDETPVDL